MVGEVPAVSSLPGPLFPGKVQLRACGTALLNWFDDISETIHSGSQKKSGQLDFLPLDTLLR